MHITLKSAAVATALSCLSLVPALSVAAGNQAEIKRGAQLVEFGGCKDCHVPFKMGPKGPERDEARGMSGHPADLRSAAQPPLDAYWNWAGSATMTAFVGPWGTSYSANLTPDKETGIGAWRVGDFIQAMRTGKHLGAGRPIVPPMPWQAVGSLSDKDLQAIYAYLMSRPAVNNRVPDYTPPAAPMAAK